MEELVKSHINILNNENISYYDYYKTKYCSNSIKINDDLKDRLNELRKNRSNEMNIPTYYVFTNDEL